MGPYLAKLSAAANWVAKPLGDESLFLPAKHLFLKTVISRPLVRVKMAVLGILFSLVGLTVPIAQKYALDHLAISTQAVLAMAICLVALILSRAIEFWVRTIGLREGVIVERWLSISLYKKAMQIQSLSQKRSTVGETVALMASHLSMVTFFMTELFPIFFTSAIPVLIAPFLLVFWFDLPIWPVALILTGTFVVLLGFARVASRRFQRFKMTDEGRLGVLNEFLQNMRSVKSLCWTERFEEQLEAKTRATCQARARVVAWAACMNGFSESIPMVINVVAMLTLLYSRPVQPTPGEVMGILWTLGVFLAMPMRSLPWVLVVALDAISALRRIESYLNSEAVDTRTHSNSAVSDDSAGSAKSDAFWGGNNIKVRNLSLQVAGKRILSEIDLEIGSGEFVAIIGRVGSGKSKLLHALLGELPVAYDELSVGGSALLGQGRASWQKQFAYLPQQAFIFGASICDNVAFDYATIERANAEEITRSVSAAQLSEDLQLFPQGVHTVVGERGVTLSGGQQQRVALARANYFDRPIVLIDDTLSALDRDTEEGVIRHLLLDNWREKTRVLATHRLSILDRVDRVIFLSEGRILTQGPWRTVKDNPEVKAFIESQRKNEASYG
jgi:ABC-type multidrug transport system fused ATPase/permease subunit